MPVANRRPHVSSCTCVHGMYHNKQLISCDMSTTFTILLRISLYLSGLRNIGYIRFISSSFRTKNFPWRSQWCLTKKCLGSIIISHNLCVKLNIRKKEIFSCFQWDHIITKGHLSTSGTNDYLHCLRALSLT